MLKKTRNIFIMIGLLVVTFLLVQANIPVKVFAGEQATNTITSPAGKTPIAIEGYEEPSADSEEYSGDAGEDQGYEEPQTDVPSDEGELPVDSEEIPVEE